VLAAVGDADKLRAQSPRTAPSWSLPTSACRPASATGDSARPSSCAGPIRKSLRQDAVDALLPDEPLA